MRNRSFECQDSSTCTSTTGEGVDVHKFCFEEQYGTDDVFFCDCSPWFGWTGDNCDQVSGQLIYLRISALLSVLLTFVGFIILTSLVSSFLREAYLNGKKTKHTSGSLRIAVLTLLALFFSILYGMFNVIAAFDPSKFQVQDYHFFLGDLKTVIDVVPEGGLFWDSCIILAFAFLMMSSTQVAMSWIDLADSFPFMFGYFKNRKALEMFKRFVLISNILFFIIAIVFLSTGYVTLISVFISAVGVILLMMFLVARYRFLVFVEKLPDHQRENSAKKVIRLRKLSSRFHSALLGIIVLAGLGHGILSIEQAYFVRPGDFNFPWFLKDIALFSGISLLMFNIWYVRTLFNRKHEVVVFENPSSLDTRL